jgi:hypothetical protein
MPICTDDRRKRAEASARVAVPTLALAAAALLGAAGFVTAATAEPLRQISGPTPFAGCTADDVPGQEAAGSKNWPNSEVEPISAIYLREG